MAYYLSMPDDTIADLRSMHLIFEEVLKTKSMHLIFDCLNKSSSPARLLSFYLYAFLQFVTLLLVFGAESFSRQAFFVFFEIANRFLKLTEQ